MAEQDRYGGWFGGKAASIPSPSDVAAKLPNASGAEQDRYGAHFSNKLPSTDAVLDKLPRTSGAEQDRYESHFGRKAPSMSDLPGLPKTSGAEQDRYEAHFGGKAPSLKDLPDLPKTSGAEQDRYGAHFSGKAPSASDLPSLPKTSGAEQDRYGAHFSGKAPSAAGLPTLPKMSGAEQDRYGAHFAPSPRPTAVGLLQSAVVPSLGLHTGLSLAAYGVARATGRVDGKDWLWPVGITANAWWSAVGARVVNDGLTLGQAWSSLAYSQKLLLGGVSAWGLRLFARVASRSISRGKDDVRYDAAKKDPGFWNKALFNVFLPEAVAQTLISLPLTLPFRATSASIAASPMTSYGPVLHSLAVFLFSTGYALEVLADAQLEAHKQKRSDVNREGAWSIVRHPNYLGDALIHAAFPILLLGAGMLHPIALVGPVANYLFLRYVGGDKENEASQEERYASDPEKRGQWEEYKFEKNSFWPSLRELTNKWTWTCVIAGLGGVVLERGIQLL